MSGSPNGLQGGETREFLHPLWKTPLLLTHSEKIIEASII